MTVENQTMKVTGLGNGVATVFSFSPMVIYASTDLQVTHVDAAGAETLLTEGVGAANYSVTVALYPGTGSITYPADAVTPMPAGESLVAKVVLTLEQQTNLENQGGYDPDVQETALDKLVRICLQQQEELDRTLKAVVSATGTDYTLPTALADNLIGWNAAANGLENKVPNTDTYLSMPLAIAQGGTASITATAARTSLGIISATLVAEGLIELGTQAEVDAGTDALRAVTPATLKAWRVATAANPGPIELATQAEVDASDATRAVTGATLAAWSGLPTSAMDLIASATASASTSIDFTGLSTTYFAYRLIFDGVVFSASNVPFMRTSIDNGSTFTSAAGSYAFARERTGTATTSGGDGVNSTTEMRLISATLLLNSNHSGEIVISNPANAATNTSIWARFAGKNSASNFMEQLSTGQRLTAEANNAIRFAPASGTITTGNFRLYGLKAA